MQQRVIQRPPMSAQGVGGSLKIATLAATIVWHIALAVLAPFIGWLVGRLFRLDAPAGRAIAFSAGTRNSLVVLPLALAVPGAIPVQPAIIVTQTLVELFSELIYVRLIPKLTNREFKALP